MNPMRGLRPILACALVALSPAVWAEEIPPAGGEVPAARADLVEIHAEMLVIGKEGSRRAGSERAVVPPGKVGLLRSSVSLPLETSESAEEIGIELRVRVESLEDGLHLNVDSRAQGKPSGELVIRSGGGLLTGTSPMFYETYVSQLTGERVVFLLSARPWEEAPRGPAAADAAAPRPVAYALSIYRLTEAGPELLESPRLASLVGHAATYSFGFTLALPEGETRREELQIRLKAVEIRDHWLSGILSLEGDVGGSPVSRSRGWALPSGGEAEIDLRIPGGEGQELGFRIRVDLRF
jgi:hypothetical protein